MIDSDPLISRTLGNYEIVDRLGRGGMATVYRAHQVNMNRDVAVKVLSAELAEDPQFVARFEHEAQVIAHLEHPRIVPVHDFGCEGGLCYLVMRLVEGETLYDRILQGALSPEKAARYLDQIAEALDYAHARGVIHRDLKPNNILIDRLDNIYMMDFGLAKLVASSQHLTATGTVLGTPAYMAPEQWRGEPVDARTDLYALGVILYEMVVGKLPFEASDTPFSLMYKHLNDPPPPPRKVLPTLPEGVEQVILRALAKEPEARYTSAGALAADFAAALRGEPISAPPEPVRAPNAAPEVASAPAVGGELPVQPPPLILPPPAVVLPIPVPPGAGGRPLSEYDPPTGQPPAARGSELPEHVPPAVRNVVEWAAEKAEQVSIPGFIAPTAPEARALPVVPDADQWPMPVETPAFRQMSRALLPGEELAGVLYARGTASWRNWRRILIGALVLSILGGALNVGVLNFIGVLGWLYLGIQLFRTWRGHIGHYYIGFTERRIIIQPLIPGEVPNPSLAEGTSWAALRRFAMSDEYLWLETPGSEGIHFLGWLPSVGVGGLERQRKWLPGSPITALIYDRGFSIRF